MSKFRTQISIVVPFLTLIALCSAYPNLVIASPAHDMCDAAAETVARESGVPLSVMRAISRAETGRTLDGVFMPWPWTVNMQGTGKWFETQDAARAYVFRHFKKGARSFDVGCFQINYKWHGHAFSSIEEMFDPVKNAQYAAKFLTSLKAELGSWTEAVGAYHSRTPKYANLYKARFKKIQAGLSDELTDLPIETVATANNFPLLRKQKHDPNLGSLVPLGRGKTRSSKQAFVAGG